ncbi:Extradiol ring-cleavage dioxygenase, class III enzyme, subunit B [Echria macrotheca]|uniref:Extradiol ring-cleavage dioxygenase, class III enzyme, subunit B n=1 Tax=Echria macrotheca TaxID=438768 RepID=A0AAJ0BHP4_9PEZI|nr:Extradiol ring-cleavage dioxygenase, class III enzyme, subunit B [Echria macrotheca]
MWRRQLILWSIAVPIVIGIFIALLQSSSSSFSLNHHTTTTPFSSLLMKSLGTWSSNLSLFVSKTFSTKSPSMSSSTKRMPVYFFSHGGPDVQYNTAHPAYAVLQSIGREITQRVRPKAVVVFSAHWQPETPSEIHINSAVTTPLVYDFYNFPPSYYKATFPSTGSPQLASHIQSLLSSHSIPSRLVTRGLDHGVFSGFNVAFPPSSPTESLTVPLVQVSLFASEDPDAHYNLGRAVSSLRDEGVVIICTGMTVHNLRDFRISRQKGGQPLPYVVSFDEALKDAVEAAPDQRQDRMREAAQRPDARQAHPWMDHLMPLYIAAGAGGDDRGRRTWTMHEGSFAWGQYRFGDVPDS